MLGDEGWRCDKNDLTTPRAAYGRRQLYFHRQNISWFPFRPLLISGDARRMGMVLAAADTTRYIIRPAAISF